MQNYQFQINKQCIQSFHSQKSHKESFSSVKKSVNHNKIFEKIVFRLHITKQASTAEYLSLLQLGFRLSGQSVSRITQADGSRAILEPRISSSKVILQLHRDYFLSARTHYNMNFVLNLQYVFGPNTAPAQECSPTEYFEYRDVWSIQLQRMSDLKSISHYLQLVFVIYL
ncbi:Hypothetical_protein [Hexamita inflata]|uniref:Hypothetical_protein n=1 Tax=Hexamita inflata TaxID=28002 RepID=A0ABP1J4X7_9EUKA